MTEIQNNITGSGTVTQTEHTASGAIAQSAHEISHEHTLYAEPIYHIGDFPITNSLLNSWLVVLIVIILGVVVKIRTRLIPRGIQNIFEMVFELFFNTFDAVTGERKKTLRFTPLVFAFFMLILLNNWLGLFPGVGSIGQIVQEEGRQVFVPYFRGGTADLNTTLALATIGVVVSHLFGIFTIGFFHHFNKFFNLGTLFEIPRKMFKDPTVIIVNPIKFLVGIIEAVGEVAKIASLSFRLFGNIFAGEVLLASMSAILAFGLPLPFMFLEVIVGLIQALIFAMLILVYLSMHTTAEEH